MIYYLLIIVVLFVLISVFGANKIKTIEKSYKYYAKNHIMTKREERFFRELCQIFEKQCYVIPQVHLSALLEHKVKGQNWKGAFAHIHQKSVDYVLLRKKDLSVLCAVELDDITHTTSNRRKRDIEVERIFKQVGIPLVRIKHPEKMAKQEIVDYFAQVINRS